MAVLLCGSAYSDCGDEEAWADIYRRVAVEGQEVVSSASLLTGVRGCVWPNGRRGVAVRSRNKLTRREKC